MLLYLVAFATPAFAQAAPTTAPAWKAGDLQAHGSDERLWLARVETVAGRTPTEITNVYVREKSEATWRRLDQLGVRALGLANRGSQLALLLPGGDWRLTTDVGYSTGGPLPEGAKLLALGSDGATLWGVGITRADATASTTQSSTTSPSTQAAATATVTAATRSATTTAPSGQPKLMLYRLGPRAWEPLGTLPDEIPTNESVSLSLAGVGGMPLLAYKRDDQSVRIWRRTSTPVGGWDALGEVAGEGGGVAEFKVLGGTPAPTLWYRGTSGPGHLWIAPSGQPSVDRPLTGGPANAPHAIAVANGAVRELWIADGKIFEQRLNPASGTPEGDPAPAVLPAPSMQGVVIRVLEVTLAISLVLALLSSMRRRGELSEGELDPARFRLAPFGLRLAAGAIDAIPIFAGLLLVRFRTPGPAGESSSVEDWMIVAAGVVLYMLLTTAMEMAAGRSIGKMVTGLHIVGLNGRPATAGARLLRNLFRIIDLLIAGMPLALILFSPLRQRAGDLGAGTIVVQGESQADAPATADNADDATPRRRRSDADSE